MVKLLCSVIGIVIASAAWPAVGGEPAHATAHQFSDFAVGIYHGRPTYPQLKGDQRSYRDYRTRIRDSVAAGPNFAGHYAVAVIGCGTDCRFGFITDLRTGIVRDLPLGGEENYELLYRLRPNSRLLEAQWMRLDDKADRLGCALEDFIWTGQAFRSLGRRTLTDECPQWDDVAD